MNRRVGYYWVLIECYQNWHISYWDGLYWKFNGLSFTDKSMRRVIESPLKAPEPSKENMFMDCASICNYWSVSFSWVIEKDRSNHRPVMKKVIWYILKNKYPSVTYIELANLVGHKDHAGVANGLKTAKNWIKLKDKLFMKYYEPVKHLLHEQSINA